MRRTRDFAPLQDMSSSWTVKNKIGDAMRIQYTALDASRLFVDPVFRSVCCSLCAAVFPGHRT